MFITLKEDLYEDGFFIYPAGTRKAISGIRYNDESAFQVYLNEIGIYVWVSASKCDFNYEN